MAKIYTAPMAQTINNSTAVLTTATGGITTDAPTNSVLLFTAGTEGSIVTTIEALPRASITTTAIYLFSSQDSGVTLRLIDSILIPAYTYSTINTVPQTVFTNYSEDYPLRLKANERLYVACSVTLASGIVVEARGVDY